jgi:hypothetical protein
LNPGYAWIGGIQGQGNSGPDRKNQAHQENRRRQDGSVHVDPGFLLQPLADAGLSVEITDSPDNIQSFLPGII